MKKRYIFLILFIPFAICIGSLLWYRSRPQPLPTVTPGPTPLVTATIPPSKISSLDPAWSPDGSRIAYILIRDNIPTLVVRDLETGEELSLVEDAIEILSHTWSPLGDKIAFSAKFTEEAKEQIYTIHLESLQMQKLTNETRGVGRIFWSPTGDHIAYTDTELDDFTFLTLINPNGGIQEFIEKIPSFSAITWSPDGMLLGFTKYNLAETTSEITLKRLGQPTYQTLSEEGTAIFELAWSPDAQWIAYTAYGIAWGEIHAISLDGETILKLTDGVYDDHLPTWSPDGNTVAFLRSRSDDAASAKDIFLISKRGDNLRQLTNTTFNEISFVWSPTGDQIAMTVADPMPPFLDVYIINIDDSGIYRLRDNSAYP